MRGERDVANPKAEMRGLAALSTTARCGRARPDGRRGEDFFIFPYKCTKRELCIGICTRCSSVLSTATGQT
jgi:hypothetical protein